MTRGVRRFCSFRVGPSLFGVHVEEVQEILRHQPLTRVPLAPAEVRGLVNLRGQIVPAIDLRRRLGLPELGPAAEPANVILRGEAGTVSLLVDEIGDVIEVDAGTFEAPPDTVRGPSRGLIRGVHKLEDGLLLVLDPEAAVGGKE